MNLFELFVKIGVDDQASGKLSNLSSKLGNGLKTAAKIGTAAVGAAAAGITALTKAAVDNYAEYEQLVGGVQTLFGLQGQSLKEYAATVGKTTDEALDDWLKYTTGERKILNNAEEAYKSAGLSMNQYMETVTSFSASLIASLGGDTAKAADYADMAIVDMADNANKMGTSMEMLQTTYAGFAKQNYTMLDNLKLGYGGTKTEMERLLKDAQKLPQAMGKKFDISNFSDVVEAIHLVQENMGIAGATALEAGTTIEGSVNSMKAAWSNLVTGFADGNADIELLIENLVETIVGDGTENNLGVIGNVLPAIETALGGVAKLIEGAAPKIIEILPGLVERVVPSVISAATGMVDAVIKVVPDLLNTVVDALIQNAPALITAANGLVQSLIQGIQDNYQILVDGAVQIVTQLATGILNMLPQIVQLGLDLIVSLADGIAENTDELLPTIFDVVGKIIGMIIENAPRLAEAAFGIIDALGNSLAEEIPGLSWVFENLETAVIAVTAAMVAYKTAMSITSLIETVKNAITAFKVATEGQTIAQTLLNAVMNANPFALVATLVAGLVAALITLWHTNDDFRNALIKAWDAIKNAAVVVWESIVKFFTEDIPNAFNAVINFVKNNWQSLLLFITNPIAGALKLLYDLNPKFKEWVDNLLGKIKSWIGGIVNIGSDLVAGLKRGIQNAWYNLKSWFKGLFGDLIGIAKRILGIRSPSKVFKEIGGFTAEGFGIGFEDEFAHVKDDMEDALNFDDASVGINASIRKVGAGAAGGAFGGTSIGNININIDGAKYSDENALADAIAERLQMMTDRRAAVYA